MTNREWVRCPFSGKRAYFTLSHDQQKVCDIALFSATHSHHISSHQQQVSDTTFFLKCNFITFHPILNSLWVILPCLLQVILLSHDLQGVCDIVLFFCQAASPQIDCLMTYSKSVTLPFLSTRHSHHISFHEYRLWVTVPLFCWCHYIIQWLTGSVWCCSFICHVVLSYHMTNRKSVTLPLFSTRQSHDITNSLWVLMPCFCKVVSSLIPWPTASEWTTLFLVSSDLISWQTGSGCPAYFYCHGFSWHLISWPTGSE